MGITRSSMPSASIFGIMENWLTGRRLNFHPWSSNSGVCLADGKSDLFRAPYGCMLTMTCRKLATAISSADARLFNLLPPT